MERYDVQKLIQDLKGKSEIDPDSHDGSYQMMRETIQAYAHLQDMSVIDYIDLNLVYLTSVGTWTHGLETKKKLIDESHLGSEDKVHLKSLWDAVWEKAGQGIYSNSDSTKSDGRSIGMFGTGVFSFKSKTTSECARSFISMCVDIFPMDDDDEMYDRAAQVLIESFMGMTAAAASMVLHCLKPYTFPILNANMGNENIFQVLGIPLKKKGNIETYIDNCRKIKEFRDLHFHFRNYRVFDIAAWGLKDYEFIHKVWLLAWNKEKWQWDNYEQICENTKAGRSFEDCWSCSNKNAKIGDEIFLIKLGDQPRGIVGHGYVSKETYIKEHYDPAKAAEGKTEQCIDVRFDRLIDYEKDRFISQDELNQKCSQQHWSPQNSGIEIKAEVIPILNKLWKSVTEEMSFDKWEPSLSEYDPGLTAQQYHDLFLNEKVISHDMLITLHRWYMMTDHAGTCTQLKACFGDTVNRYNSHISTAGENIHKATGCLRPPEVLAAKWWPVVCLGRYMEDKSQGGYCYKLRDPVVAAIEMLIDEGVLPGKERHEMTVHYDRNMILYGPPGTGKTYNTVNYAVAVCEGRPVEEIMAEPYDEVLLRYNELKKAGRVEFTTFHQSYGYEEFIEGIKPKLDDEDETLGYTIEDGIFKAFCHRADLLNIQVKNGAKIKEQPRIWLVILDGPGMTLLKRKCFEKNEIRIGWSEVEDENISDNDSLSWRAKQMLHAFAYEMEPGDIVFIEKDYHSIDAIGVIAGNYEYDSASSSRFPRRRKVEWIAKEIDEDMVQYLPNGRAQLARVTVCSLDYLGTAVLSEILQKYMGDLGIKKEQAIKPYVFIIDEINRGNISKIFGELITLIEDTKRKGAPEAMEVVLPYSGEPFSVPGNVFIIGTMNTADRSIALMDTALRRRFSFVEMMPESGILLEMGAGVITADGVELNVARMLDVINERIVCLYDREHTIGHAYFMKLAKDPTIETLAGIFEKNVIPLLQEYFYEDYGKIQLVLGDNAKEDEFKFILDKAQRIKDIFNGNPDIDIQEKGYMIQHEAFLKIESYKQIG